MAENEDDDLGFLDFSPAVETKQKVIPTTPALDEGDGFDDFMSGAGMQRERDVPDPEKPWMRFHEFKLVQSISEVETIVDNAIAHKSCSLDLETEGFDNRIFYDPQGNPQTVHKIVGFCISVDGKIGYYIPVRHKPGEGMPDLNVRPVEQVEAAIRRLCLASQPTPKGDPKDLLSFKDFEVAPQLVIEFWNAKFDQEFLFPITGIDWWHPDSFEDGCLAAFTVYSDDEIGLKPQSKTKLFVDEHVIAADGSKRTLRHPYEMIELKELFLKGRPILFATLSPDEPGVKKYACSDAICTKLLCQQPGNVKLAREKYGFTYRLEKQLSQAGRVMERNRVKVNRTKVKTLLDRHTLKRDELAKKINSLAESKGFFGFDPDSPKQLGEFLFGERGLDITPKPDRNEKSQQYKTDGETLETMTKDMGENAPQVLKWIVSFREEQKLLGTYLNNLYNNFDARVKVLSEMRFDFKQTGAATGRFSAPSRKDHVSHGFSGVPPHGIPGTSDLRTCFEAREGYAMVKADYAGQELRIVTNLSNEPVWVKEFLEGTGDLHTITARAFFGKQEVTKEERKGGKIANFALVYGGGPQAIMRATGCDKVEGQRRKQAFDKAVPTFAKWVKEQHARVKKDKGVWTAFGRWIAIPDADIKEGDILNKGTAKEHAATREETNMIRAACERAATNYPIQGSGADIMKIAMVLLHKEFHRRGWLRVGGDDSVRMLLTVHDELVFEVRYDRVAEAMPLIVEQMELPTKMARPPYSPLWQVPLVVEPLIGMNWGAGYKVERFVEGHEIKEDQVLLHGYVYSLTRECEKEAEIQENETVLRTVEKGGKKTIIVRLTETPPWVHGVPMGAPTPPSAPRGSSGGGSSSTPSSTPPPLEKKNGATKIVTIRLKELSPASIRQVRGVVAQYLDLDHGALLRLIDAHSMTLIDPNLGVKVDPEMVAGILREMHLSDGQFILST